MSLLDKEQRLNSSPEMEEAWKPFEWRSLVTQVGLGSPDVATLVGFGDSDQPGSWE